MDKSKVDILSQLINGMEDAIVKLERAYENKKTEDFENAKRIILRFQQKLSEELK